MGDTDDAAFRLHLLDTEFREHPNHGPSERRAPQMSASAPLNLDMLDHLDRCRDEVIQHARAGGATLRSLPTRVREVYDWWEEQTKDAAPQVQLQRDIVIYRQSLENAIRLGDEKVVRPHPCPGCGTYGLEWQPRPAKAICVNRRCRDKNGMAHQWSLARLATQYVMEQEKRRRRAT